MNQLGGGLQNLLKEGARHYSGLEEAILKNIDACKQLTAITRTSLGPLGMNKMVVNNLEKLFVTTDAATIMKELDVHHPAARLIALASKFQETESGDGTNFVVILAGELLKLAEELIQTGLHPSEIVNGYERASAKADEIIPQLVAYTVTDFRNKEQIEKCLRPVIASKIYGYENHLAACAAEAGLIVTEGDIKFEMDNVRILKLQGGNLGQTEVVRGLILSRAPEGSVKHVKDAKIAVYNCPLDPQSSDTKGTVLLTNAEELKNYTQSEEDMAKKLVQEIVDAGVKVVVAGGSIAEIVMHFLELNNIMVVKVPSKFEVRRFCKMLGATMVVRLGAPTPEELGYADSVSLEEISSNKVTVFKRENERTQIATVVVRASTKNVMDDAERALDDAFNTFRMLRKDPRFVVGGGACEAEIAKRIKDFAATQPGLDQYAIMRYAQAFEIIPKTLAETAGLDSNEFLAKIYAENNPHAGIDIEEGSVKDVSDFIVDHMETKRWAIKLASDAALTVLRVDQIIMAKPAGGPKPGARPPEEDD
ncbi:unnamed protein product [Blepharisma stoltei]|uniref:CCT-theta n=1 Tax=Blepharisma stoltei TaxID=1481888 RepID=A0AAU9JKD4_9CILI|nr:unnamed protein product [Blepharisma stoltei]